MLKMINRSATLALLIAIASSFGCATTDGEDPVICETIAGTLVGGTIGGAIGLAVALNEAGVRNGEGIAMGALGGGLLGALVGHHFEVSRLKDEIARLKAERDKLQAELNACRAENEKLKAEIDRLNKLIAELQKGRTPVGAPIVIDNSVLFAPGSDRLTSQGKAVLDGVAGRVKDEAGKGNSINIEGHTDSDPIKYSKWKSNWELGAARGLAVLHYFQDNHGVQGARLSATSFGEFHPISGNDSKDGKSKNRRSVIAIWAGDISAETASKK